MAEGDSFTTFALPTLTAELPIGLRVDPIVWWFDLCFDSSVFLEQKEQIGAIEKL
jgi:hypothetical protein